MYSVQTQVSDGTLTQIELSIEFFAREDITVYRDLETTPLILGVDWNWNTDAKIDLLTNVPVPAGTTIVIRRNTNKDRAFNIYDGNAPFSRETLDENFRQVIYLAQEFTEGNGLSGVFFPLDMHGFKITNLGDGVDAADAVNKGQLDVVDNRVTSIENGISTNSVSYPWYAIATTETDTFSPPIDFIKASVYLDGVCQVPGYSYIVVDNQIVLSEPVRAGTIVFARLGEEFENTGDFATATALMQVRQELLDAISALEAALEGDINGLDTRTSALELRATNLETRMTVEENATQPVNRGGTGATTASGALTNLGAAPIASPTFTGVPSAPTAAAGTNTTQLATTAFVAALGALKANLASPTFTGTPSAPTATAGDSSTQIATTAFVATAVANGKNGVTDASNAAAGKVGEVLSATGTLTAYTTATQVNTVSLVLTPGDWEVQGVVLFDITSGSTATQMCGLTTTSATVPAFPDRSSKGGADTYDGNLRCRKRINVSANTTMYLAAYAEVSSGTLSLNGYIEARRMR